MADGQTEKPARFWRMGACSLIPWQSTDMQRFASRYESRGMGGRSLHVDVQCKAGLQIACNLDQSAMVTGRMEKTCAVSEGRSVFSDPLVVD